MDTVLYDVRPAPIRRHPFLFALLVAGSLVLVGIPLLVGWWVRVRSARLAITPTGTVMTSGLCWGGYAHVRHGEVSELHVKQSAWQRSVGVGDLTVRGRGGETITVEGIPAPERARQIIYGRSRGERIASEM